jgi:hypothetical protein
MEGRSRLGSKEDRAAGFSVKMGEPELEVLN